MLEGSSDVVYVAGFVLVSVLVIARVYVGEHYFNDRARFWSPIRRFAIPLLHRLFQRADDDLYAETSIGEDELVDVVDRPPEDVLEDLAAAGYEPNPLASLATDWEGRTEIASWAHYEGRVPFDGAPDFLRPRQVHVRLFAAEGEPDMIPVIGDLEPVEKTVITAHEEATAWRPDLWQDHYGGETMDVETGVAMAAFDLGLEDVLDEIAEELPSAGLEGD